MKQLMGVFLTVILLTSRAAAADWPRFRGPDGTGKVVHRERLPGIPGGGKPPVYASTQQKQVAALEADVKAKLEKILTPEQLQQLKQMRPPPRQGGKGGGGPGGGGNGTGQPDHQRPPSE